MTNDEMSQKIALLERMTDIRTDIREMAKSEAKTEAKKSAKTPAAVTGGIVGAVASIIVALVTPTMEVWSSSKSFEHNLAIEAVKAAGKDPKQVEDLLNVLCERQFFTRSRDKNCKVRPAG
jgi:hypothetical protein